MLISHSYHRYMDDSRSSVASDVDALSHRSRLHPSSWCNGNHRSTTSKVQHTTVYSSYLTWKSWCFRSMWLWVMHRSNNTGTQSGRCSIKPNNGVRYFTLLRSSASFHLNIPPFIHTSHMSSAPATDRSWAMMAKHTSFCFFMMAKSKKVAASLFTRNSADFERSRSTHSTWPAAAAQCKGVMPRRLMVLIRWAWACRMVFIVETCPWAAASCKGVSPS